MLGSSPADREGSEIIPQITHRGHFTLDKGMGYTNVFSSKPGDGTDQLNFLHFEALDILHQRNGSQSKAAAIEYNTDHMITLTGAKKRAPQRSKQHEVNWRHELPLCHAQ
jgi:hypothetical protein